MTRDIVLIHGTWGHASNWDEMKAELVERGYTVHTPLLRYHDLPMLEAALEIGTVSIGDYVDDLVRFVTSLGGRPILCGVSMGGLLAQLVAARCQHAGLVLLSPAPAWGMFPFYPSMVRTFHYHFFQWAFWRKPLYPSWEEFRWGVVNEQTPEKARAFFLTCGVESGRAYVEMAFWFLDWRRRTRVDTEAIEGPVLVFCGSKDRVVAPRVARLTARRYGKRGTLVTLPQADHVMMIGDELKNTMGHFDAWIEEQGIPAS